MAKKTSFFIILILILFLTSGCIRVEKGLENGGVYKSVNQGDNWKQKADLLSLPGQQRFLDSIVTNVLVFDPQDGNTLYLGTRSNGLFVSFDSANSWQEVKRFSKEKVNAISVHPKAKHIVYVATNNRIYKTTDANRTWRAVYLEAKTDTEITSLQIDRVFPKIIFAGFSDGRLIKSINGGESWTNIKNFERKVKQILINPYNTQIIYLVVGNKGIYRSEDKGENWLSLEESYRDLIQNNKIQKIYSVPNIVNALVCITESDILRSDNYGDDWDKYNLLSTGRHLKIYSLAFNSQDSKIFYYTNVKALYQSIDNGENWTTKSLPNKRIPEVLLNDPINTDILYLGLAGF